MKVTINHDFAAGTVQVVMDMQIGADPDGMADLAWQTVTRAMTVARREAGTVPDGLRRRTASVAE